MSENAITPEWVKDAIFYQIFPDRFAKSEQVEKPARLEAWDAPPTVYGFKGGDLLGVAERLDYLQDLGITAIYFTPIFQSASNHRYHTHDYFKVDPLLGGDAAFHTLLTEAHRRRMRIVLDGVFNHASRGFFQFNHILENEAGSPYLDWFNVHGFPLNAYQGQPNYDCWVGLPALPKFNTRNPQVRQFIFNVARYWLEQGMDGWRLDVPFEIDDDSFWQEFRQVVKRANPDAYIVGEIAWEAQRWLQGDQFDAVMNYQFMQMCLGFFGGDQVDRQLAHNLMGLPAQQPHTAAGFARRAVELLEMYPLAIAQAQMNLLDSHDMPRFSGLVRHDWAAVRLAVLFMLTYPGAPCLYYGDEIGLRNGPRPIPEDCRFAFTWDETRWDHDLLKFYQQAIALRRAEPALRRGAFIPLYAEGQALVYLRRLGKTDLLVAINNGPSAWTLEAPAGETLAEGSRWASRLAVGMGLSAAEVTGGWLQGASLPPRSGLVLRRE